MGAQALEINTIDISLNIDKQICLYCNNSNIERQESGMLHMICKLSGEGKNSFSTCRCYKKLEVQNVCSHT